VRAAASAASRPASLVLIACWVANHVQHEVRELGADGLLGGQYVQYEVRELGADGLLGGQSCAVQGEEALR